MMGEFGEYLAALNGILWHEYVLYAIVGTGLLFTIWSGFSQYRALTHGPMVIRGVYDDPDDPGAINHFQALSAALSATVGLGNIGGVALAIALGGLGAVFWMWVIGFLGMSIKLTEVTLSKHMITLPPAAHFTASRAWFSSPTAVTRQPGMCLSGPLYQPLSTAAYIEATSARH